MALPACSLFVDLSGLSSNATDDGEGGIDSGLAHDATASSDAAQSEASIDAGPSEDPCTTTHALCENFDEDSGSYGGEWSPQSDHAIISIATDASVSPPASLRIVGTSNGASGGIFATLNKAPFPKGLKCAFAMQVDNYPRGTTVQFLDVQVTTSDPSISSYELGGTGGTQNVTTIDEYIDFNDGGSSYNSKDSPFMVFDGNWHQLVLTITLSGSPSLELDVDGTFGALEPLAPPGGLAAVVLVLGFEADNSVGPGWTSRFDNVVCDWIN